MQQLPKEIIEHIKYFCQSPQFDIIKEETGSFYQDNIVYLIVRYNEVTITIQTIIGGTICNKDKYIIMLLQFIEDLANNKDCIYDESYGYGDDATFCLKIKDNTIIIEGTNIKINLTIENKKQLIETMKKYHTILKTTKLL